MVDCRLKTETFLELITLLYFYSIHFKPTTCVFIWILIYFFNISADCLAARSLPAGGLLLEAEWNSVGGDGLMVAFLDMN